MELVNVEAVEETGYDKDSLIGVDLVTGCPDEKIFCQLFPQALNEGKAEIRMAENNRLVLEYIGEGQETRTFKMSKKQAERIEICLSDPNYKRRVCFLNDGYNALAIRFIRKGSTKQSLLIKKQERN
ncbi:MAG: hypothetical protein WA092_02650 [Minisyncoccales bacterium]